MKQDHYGLSSPVETPRFSCVYQTWCWISDGFPSHHWWELHKRLWQRASQCPFLCFWMLWCCILWLHPRRLSMWLRLLVFDSLLWIIFCFFGKGRQNISCEVVGSLMAIFGFLLSYRCSKKDDRNGTEISESLTPWAKPSFHSAWNRSLYATLLIPLPATLRQFSVWLWKYQAKGSKLIFWHKSMLKCMS